MYEDSKLTYLVIIGLVIVLSVIAYFLQGSISKEKIINTFTTTTPMNTTSTTTKRTFFKKETKTDNVEITATTSTMNNIPRNVTGATIKTNMGDIEVEFATSTPNTVVNFISLVATKFYDGVKFHRVIKGFMIQGGDPLSKDIFKKAYWGTGGPGYKFKDELTGNEIYTQGTLAMANSGPDTNGSQFFIVTAYPKVDLPPSYTIFGHVTKGMDIALTIENVKTDSSDRPIDDVVIESITLK